MPSGFPSGQPTSTPSLQPSGEPTVQPTSQPSSSPSAGPSSQPSGEPTVSPSAQPSSQPTTVPSGQPSAQPTSQPSGFPSGQPTIQPSVQPTTVPSSQPSGEPTVQPSPVPSLSLTAAPSIVAQDINLDSLGTKGNIVFGTSNYDYVGYQVIYMGDINGDKIADFSVSQNVALESYIIYGQKEGFSDLPLSTSISSDQGFYVKNAAYANNIRLSHLGKINKDDKFDAFIVSTADTSDGNKGVVYIFEGQNDPFGNIDLDNTDSYFAKITGANDNDHIGFFIAGLGDIDGNGYPDMVIGTESLGKAYVILGQENFNKNIDLANLSSVQGFIISSNKLVYGGYKVTFTAVGDINGDGKADYAIGIANENIIYVIYGQETNIDINLDNLLPSQGFTISGNGRVGVSISKAGDQNGDEIDDFIIGVPYSNIFKGITYVFYGNSNGLSNINLDSETLTNDKGFAIIGGVNHVASGYSVVSDIDVNKDGIPDIAVTTAGVNSEINTQIIFGTGQSIRSNIYLDSVVENQGLVAFSSQKYSAPQVFLSSVGDTDGNGYKDLAIGAFRAEVNGVPGAGAVYLITDIYGSSTGSPSVAPTSSSPSTRPTEVPSIAPSQTPSLVPTKSPDSTHSPTSPTSKPSAVPTVPTIMPSIEPTSPTRSPTMVPSAEPTLLPSSSPTMVPSAEPTLLPSSSPTIVPSTEPTEVPSFRTNSNPPSGDGKEVNVLFAFLYAVVAVFGFGIIWTVYTLRNHISFSCKSCSKWIKSKPSSILPDDDIESQGNDSGDDQKDTKPKNWQDYFKDKFSGFKGGFPVVPFDAGNGGGGCAANNMLMPLGLRTADDALSDFLPTQDHLDQEALLASLLDQPNSLVHIFTAVQNLHEEEEVKERALNPQEDSKINEIRSADSNQEQQPHHRDTDPLSLYDEEGIQSEASSVKNSISGDIANNDSDDEEEMQSEVSSVKNSISGDIAKDDSDEEENDGSSPIIMELAGPGPRMVLRENGEVSIIYNNEDSIDFSSEDENVDDWWDQYAENHPSVSDVSGEGSKDGDIV